jgi:hypothetical protein
MEATYSLVSSAVELLELRQQLAAAEMRQGAAPAARHTAWHRVLTRRAARRTESAEDDLMEMHTNYEILTNQLLVEQARGFGARHAPHAELRRCVLGACRKPSGMWRRKPRTCARS